MDIADRYNQLRDWEVPSDTWKYLLSKNMVPLMERICNKFGYSPKSIGAFLGHTFKNIEGKNELHKNFSHEKIYELFRYINEKKLIQGIAKFMMPVIYEFPDMQFSSVLTSIHFKRRSLAEIVTPVEFLYDKFKENTPNPEPDSPINWLMGQVHQQALGNVKLADLRQQIEQIIKG
ncbi:MAG: hypothetical protein KAH12_09790, partial [Anaerolineales bacterium]|nr:hypothetical protein [Anaerolineales bacterium]